MNSINLDGNSLSLEQCGFYLSNYPVVEISSSAIERMEMSRKVVEKAIATGETIYGVNTGFGKLANVRIDNEQLAELQLNLVRSHAAGTGDPFPVDLTRLIILLKANALAKGFSGCRPIVAETIVAILNAGIRPIIPSKGSVGASGDLAPLAHLALTVIGEGQVIYRGRQVPAAFALHQADITPIDLLAKEGLAILNGTQASLAYGVDAILRLRNLIKVADIIGAMSVEALKGTDVPFRPEIQAVRGQAGQAKSAENLFNLLQESEIHESHRDCGKVQDMYSLRCMPQVHGASRDALQHAEMILSRELNACTDNPIVLPDSNEIISGGNFHAEPVGMVLDLMAVATAELGSISERRIASMMDPTMSQMPAFLTDNSGVESGYMIPHVTAASLVSENKSLAHPATVDSIPTSANQEDHVSMAPIAGKKLREIVGNTEQILAIEWLCAAQGLDYKDGLQPAKALQPSYKLLRRKITRWTEDRIQHNDIQMATELLQTGQLTKVVHQEIQLV